MTGIAEWGQPVGHGNARLDWRAIVEQCKARPGEWALLDIDRRTNYGARFGLEITTRQVDGKLKTWVRWPE